MPTCPVFTRAKIKSRFGDFSQFAVTRSIGIISFDNGLTISLESPVNTYISDFILVKLLMNNRNNRGPSIDLRETLESIYKYIFISFVLQSSLISIKRKNVF